MEQQTLAPDFWNDTQKASQLQKDLEAIRADINLEAKLSGELGDIKSLIQLLDESPDAELEQETRQRLDQLQATLDSLEFRQMLSAENDDRNAILSINAGAGGTESCDWAEMLLRMYRMWSDRHGYKNDILDFTPGDSAGFRSITMMVEGPYAFGHLKAESGVHRLVRISPFDASKRRHTSFASVFVMPDVEDKIDIVVKEEDLRIDTFRSSGAGGQKVNKTDSAVRLTHIPSGIVVACQNERSQHRNKDTAMKVLKARLYDLEMDKRNAEKDRVESEKKDIGFGSQIRSYVLHPYRMVKDHRTDFEVGDTDRLLNGDLDPFIKAYLLSGKS